MHPLLKCQTHFEPVMSIKHLQRLHVQNSESEGKMNDSHWVIQASTRWCPTWHKATHLLQPTTWINSRTFLQTKTNSKNKTYPFLNLNLNYCSGPNAFLACNPTIVCTMWRHSVAVLRIALNRLLVSPQKPYWSLLVYSARASARPNQRGLPTARLKIIRYLPKIAAFANGEPRHYEHRKHHAVVHSHRGSTPMHLIWYCRKSICCPTALNFVCQPMHTRGIPYRTKTRLLAFEARCDNCNEDGN